MGCINATPHAPRPQPHPPAAAIHPLFTSPMKYRIDPAGIFGNNAGRGTRSLRQKACQHGARGMLRCVAWVAAISFVCTLGPAAAGEMQPPRVTRVAVDWASATGDLGAVAAALAIRASIEETAHGSALDELNAAMAARLPGAAQSPVPVLLPFDVDGYLYDRTQGGPARLAHNPPPGNAP